MLGWLRHDFTCFCGPNFVAFSVIGFDVHIIKYSNALKAGKGMSQTHARIERVRALVFGKYHDNLSK